MQRTLIYSVACSGIGLHCGRDSHMRIHPAPEDTGIVFRRVDLDPVVEIPAQVAYVSGTKSCTAIAKDGAGVQTVEHLLSALAAFGVDNAYIDIDTEELPAMDGSACVFVLLIKSAGIRELSAPKKFIKIKRKLSVHDGDKYASLSPSPGNSFSVRFSIDFGSKFNARHPLLASYDFSTSSFVQDIGRARTFGFARDIESMRKAGLGLGASTGNAVSIDEDGSVGNSEGLRSNAELVKHKILDAFGDLSLLGCGLLGHLESHKSGHELNNKLLRKLLAHGDAWETVGFAGRDQDLQMRYDYFPTAVD